ncbi:LuxR C-terminal-related transcriptional regulator [Cytobacillus spongiae]|jgi:DNA-binding CsgD family transcriptional regulator|uniref:response regulator transcription factor n=1 Tax=Cytobacillus spongiae TaxID=2901381 RepID=UPI001F2048CB|nr:LuxR C-terminal-related transcriptional regulator [Cytobacillus spongiae]UII57754.1 LuxR C-terminal-related transcriptional regulator [Cytobacillus spongiae]
MTKLLSLEYLIELYCYKNRYACVVTNENGEIMIRNCKHNEPSKSIVEKMNFPHSPEALKGIINNFRGVQRPIIMNGYITLRPNFVFSPIPSKQPLYIFVGFFTDSYSKQIITDSIQSPWTRELDFLTHPSKDEQKQIVEELSKLVLAISEMIDQGQRERNTKKKLTIKEKAIVELVNQGLSNGEIAASLGVSENTIKSHLYRIYKKLQIHNRNELEHV